MSHPAETNRDRPAPCGVAVLDDAVGFRAMPPVADVQLLRRPPAPTEAPAPGFLRRCLSDIGSVLEWLFGAATLFVGLAVLASLPVLNLLSLGYLLEAGARVARSRRLHNGFIGVRSPGTLGGLVHAVWLVLLLLVLFLAEMRDGFIGVRKAARLGGAVLGCWLFLWPARIVADLARAAEIIDPNGRTAGGWRTTLFVLIGLTFVHVVSACARGGRLRTFFWPFNFLWLIRRLVRGGYYAEARDAVWQTAISLRLPYYFWLGVRGFIGAFAWLAPPITLLAVGRAPFPAAPLVGLAGALLLAVVLLYLPFLQMRLAATNRLRAAFDLRAARAAYCRAPWAFTFSFIATLLFALPLYLLKIEIVPRDGAWLPSLFFIAFIFPARLLTGWALGRAGRRPTPRHWFFRWTGRLPLLPVALFYVLVVFFTQYTSWNGVWSLYEQHAFLTPAPFFGM